MKKRNNLDYNITCILKSFLRPIGWSVSEVFLKWYFWGYRPEGYTWWKKSVFSLQHLHQWIPHYSDIDVWACWTDPWVNHNSELGWALVARRNVFLSVSFWYKVVMRLPLHNSIHISKKETVLGTYSTENFRSGFIILRKFFKKIIQLIASPLTNAKNII